MVTEGKVIKLFPFSLGAKSGAIIEWWYGARF
jgi:hypothetical protein